MIRKNGWEPFERGIISREGRDEKDGGGIQASKARLVAESGSRKFCATKLSVTESLILHQDK